MGRRRSNEELIQIFTEHGSALVGIQEETNRINLIDNPSIHIINKTKIYWVTYLSIDTLKLNSLYLAVLKFLF